MNMTPLRWFLQKLKLLQCLNKIFGVICGGVCGRSWSGALTGKKEGVPSLMSLTPEASSNGRSSRHKYNNLI